MNINIIQVNFGNKQSWRWRWN